MFAHIPGLETEMSEDMLKYARLIPKPLNELMGIRLNGTTFSGHSFRTTVGNTADSVCQQYYYLEEAGFRDPWLNPDFRVMASGDDVMVLTRPEHVDRVHASMELLSSRLKYSEKPIGLGQVIVKVMRSDIEGADFLSKTFHYNAGKLYCHPNYDKMLNTKEYYMGQNSQMHRNPWMYMELKRR